MAAPFVIPMLNVVDFIAEDDYIAYEGDDVAHEAVEVFFVEIALFVAEDDVRCGAEEFVLLDVVGDVLRVLYCCFAHCKCVFHSSYFLS